MSQQPQENGWRRGPRTFSPIDPPGCFSTFCDQIKKKGGGVSQECCRLASVSIFPQNRISSDGDQFVTFGVLCLPSVPKKSKLAMLNVTFVDQELRFYAGTAMAKLPKDPDLWIYTGNSYSICGFKNEGKGCGTVFTIMWILNVTCCCWDNWQSAAFRSWSCFNQPHNQREWTLDADSSQSHFQNLLEC